MCRTLDQKQIKAQQKDRDLHLAVSKHEVVPNACQSNQPNCARNHLLAIPKKLSDKKLRVMKKMVNA